MRRKELTIYGIVLVVLLFIPFWLRSAFWLRVVTEAFMWVGLAITWDLLAGYTGYLNFGHQAFFGLGAYGTALLMTKGGWPFVLTLPAAGLLAAGLALVTGFPTLRLRGAYFAIATWAMARAIQQVALILNITGGPDGLRLPPFLQPQFFFYFMLVLVAATFAIYWFLLERASFGLRLKAIREDESGAMALGLNPSRIKMQAFILSAIPAGIIGGVYAYWITFIDPNSALGDLITDQATVMAVFGGLGTLIGPAIGAIIVFAFKTYFWAYLSNYQVLYLIILGVVIAASVVFLPNGLWGTLMRYSGGGQALKKGLELRVQEAERKTPHA
jgi:branched-chain amino acid transport system permease protein